MISFARSRMLRSSRFCVPSRGQSTQSKSTVDIYRQPSLYSYFLPIQTRWQDTDQYGHVNNAVYHGYFDTLINHYLIRYCALNTNRLSSSMVGFIVSNQCSFHKPVKFPEIPLAALAVDKIGRSSVHYRLALFKPLPSLQPISLDPSILSNGCFSHNPPLKGYEDSACTTGSSTHVFVDTESEKPKELPHEFRKCLEKICSHVPRVS
ncbi:uncharacterized protein LOC136747572 [Amia ocellicauda]|uniref:uncharacterized protein LOC136747572 n=1 Tax=Amia ocellicauda TaxID=2972642 RepID=UPI003463D72C